MHSTAHERASAYTSFYSSKILSLQMKTAYSTHNYLLILLYFQNFVELLRRTCIGFVCVNAFHFNPFLFANSRQNKYSAYRWQETSCQHSLIRETLFWILSLIFFFYFVFFLLFVTVPMLIPSRPLVWLLPHFSFVFRCETMFFKSQPVQKKNRKSFPGICYVI